MKYWLGAIEIWAFQLLTIHGPITHGPISSREHPPIIVNKYVTLFYHRHKWAITNVCAYSRVGWGRAWFRPISQFVRFTPCFDQILEHNIVLVRHAFWFDCHKREDIRIIYKKIKTLLVKECLQIYILPPSTKICPTLTNTGFKKWNRNWVEKVSGLWVLLLYISFIIKCE